MGWCKCVAVTGRREEEGEKHRREGKKREKMKERRKKKRSPRRRRRGITLLPLPALQRCMQVAMDESGKAAVINHAIDKCTVFFQPCTSLCARLGNFVHVWRRRRNRANEKCIGFSSRAPLYVHGFKTPCTFGEDCNQERAESCSGGKNGDRMRDMVKQGQRDTKEGEERGGGGDEGERRAEVRKMVARTRGRRRARWRRYASKGGRWGRCTWWS